MVTLYSRPGLCGEEPGIGTGVDRWGTGGDASPPTFQLGGDHIGNVPPTFLPKKWKISCVLSPSNLHSLSACVIDTGVYK